MNKFAVFAFFLLGFMIFSCRKKHKDVEIEFLSHSGASYCGQLTPSGTQTCPREVLVVSSGMRFVYDHPLDTSITNVPNWQNKKYIATLQEQKQSCECVDMSFEVDDDVYPTFKKPVVKIKKIKLKE